MKFEYGLKENSEQECNNSYIKIKSSSLTQRLILGLILGIVISSIFSFLINIIFFNNSIDIHFYRYLYLILILIPVHELLHIIFLPKPSKAIIGLSFKYLIFYVKYENDITRNRLLLITIMPFIILSILPIFLLSITQSILIVYIILFNVIASGVDLLSLYLIAKLPKGIILKMSGNDLYYRKP